MEIIWLRLFFNVHIVSKSPAECSPPIGAFMELCSNANLPCLENLALDIFCHFASQVNVTWNASLNNYMFLMEIENYIE